MISPDAPPPEPPLVIVPGTPPAPRHAPSAVVVVAAVIGLVLGAGGMGLAWMLSGSSGATADAREACVLLERSLPIRLDVASGNRLGAAVMLAQAAAETDSTYRPLATSVLTMLKAYQGTKVEDPEFQDLLAKTRSICGEV